MLPNGAQEQAAETPLRYPRNHYYPGQLCSLSGGLLAVTPSNAEQSGATDNAVCVLVVVDMNSQISNLGEHMSYYSKTLSYC